MLTNIEKPSNIPRLLIGTALLAFSVSTFSVVTYILLIPIVSLFIPAVVESLPQILYALTDWTGIRVFAYNHEDTFSSLVIRFLVLGTAGLALAFLLAPPAYLIRKGAAGELTTSKVISLKVYGWLFVGLLIIGVILSRLDRFSNNTGMDPDTFFSLNIAISMTFAFLLVHLVLMHFLVGFWNFGCELVQPFLRQDKTT